MDLQVQVFVQNCNTGYPMNKLMSQPIVLMDLKVERVWIDK